MVNEAILAVLLRIAVAVEKIAENGKKIDADWGKLPEVPPTRRRESIVETSIPKIYTSQHKIGDPVPMFEERTPKEEAEWWSMG